MENIHLKRFQENQRKVRRPKNFRQSKSVDENSGGIRFLLQRWKLLRRHYLRGKDFFSQPRSCASPDQLHLPGVPHSQEHPQRLRSLPLGCQGDEHEKHDSCWRLTARPPSPIQSGRPCWQWSAISFSSSTPPPTPSSTSWRSEEQQCFLPFFKVFKGCLLGSQVQIWRPGTRSGSPSPS